MKITSIQKVIKVGSSLAVTIPARDAKAAGLNVGDELEASFTVVEKPQAHQVEVVALTQKLIKRHEQALKNLNQR